MYTAEASTAGAEGQGKELATEPNSQAGVEFSFLLPANWYIASDCNLMFPLHSNHTGFLSFMQWLFIEYVLCTRYSSAWDRSVSKTNQDSLFTLNLSSFYTLNMPGLFPSHTILLYRVIHLPVPGVTLKLAMWFSLVSGVWADVIYTMSKKL